VLVKTPMHRLLGTPSGNVDADQRDVWVQGMMARFGVDPEVQATALISQHSVDLNESNRGMHLRPGHFTWRQYFLALINGEDLIAQWAATAFGFEEAPEDAGVGQLDDPSLDHTMVIEEHRQTEDMTSGNYLDKARHWATHGRVPYKPRVEPADD
jgi:hypothetical protein